MTFVLQWLVGIFLLAPGVRVRRFDWETPLQWVGLRMLLSVGANGLFFAAMRAAGWLSPSVVGGWALACLAITADTLWRRRRALGGWLRETSVWAWTVFGLASLFVAVAAYWSWFFPPNLWDSLFYHLPIAKILGSGELFRAYWSDPGRHGMLLRGASGMNLLPVFMSGFFSVDSPLYRLVPPAVACGFFGSCAALVAAVRAPRYAAVGALVVVGTIIGVVFEASGYYADLVLAAYLGYVFAFSLRAVSAETTIWRSPGGLTLQRVHFWLAVTCIFATMPKRSGMVVAGLPVFVALATFLRDTPALGARKAFRLGAAGLVPAVATTPYLVWYTTLTPFPERPGTPNWSALYGRLVDVGLPRLFATDHLESLGPQVATVFFGLLTAWALRLFRTRARFTGLLPVWVLGWMVVCVYGIWSMNKLNWFNHWMRYLMPVYGVMATWCAVATVDLWEQPPGGLPAHVGHRLRKWLSRASILGVATLFVWLTPWSTLEGHVFERFGSLSNRPMASPKAKREASKWGGSYAGWMRAVELAEETDGHILSADTRIFYMLGDERIVYGAWSVPRSADSAEAVVSWLKDRGVTVLIEERNRGILQFGTADRRRGTAIADALESDAIQPAGGSDAHLVYRVVD